MKVVYLKNIEKFDSLNKSIALGFFDGFHVGHKMVLNDTIKYAKDNNVESCIITFNMSFRDFFSNGKTRDLYTIDDKIDNASKMGFDEIVIIELTSNFLELSKEEFINLFLKDASHISCGFDYTFGKDGLGNTEYLNKIFKDKINIVDCVFYNNLKVGTREIKEALDNGDLEYVNNALGHHYIMHGNTFIKNNKIYLNTDNYVPRSGKYKVILDNMECLVKMRLKKDINSINIVIVEGKFNNDIYNHKIELIDYII